MLIYTTYMNINLNISICIEIVWLSIITLRHYFEIIYKQLEWLTAKQRNQLFLELSEVKESSLWSLKRTCNSKKKKMEPGDFFLVKIIRLNARRVRTLDCRSNCEACFCHMTAFPSTTMGEIGVETGGGRYYEQLLDHFCYV